MDGLNKQEVEYRINNNLINNQKTSNSRSIKEIFSSNIITLFNGIHLVLFILVLSTGAIENTFFIGAIIINTLIGIYQEIKAKKIIDKLKIGTIDKVKVKREGKQINILPSEILIDDLLILTAGDTLPVDAKIIKSIDCEVDESIISGESNPITKKNNDLLISGSIITCGKCYATVTSINNNTYTNNLIKEASKLKDDSSYLKKSINKILKVVTFLVIPIGIMLFVTQFYSGKSTYQEAILASVAGVIGMIPDGLVLLTSISLTAGVIKMASKKVIIQRLNGIELLACVDVLCLDKTGTITDGTLEVIDVIKLDDKLNYEEIIANMVTEPINKTDNALISYFGKKNNLKIVEKSIFSSKRKYSKVKFTNGEYALGALEYITNSKLEEFEYLNKYIEKGYRIITFCKCINEFDKDKNKVLGFIILKDNIRKNAQETLEYFKKQDVKLKIISGDDPLMVCNLLKQINFPDNERFISGLDLPDNYNELKKIVNNYSIFGRMTPKQKQLIIKVLKEENTVGMIGDGVNDILALKESDCGIALASGISAARTVSEVVLTNADFGILPDIVNEGRRVVNNIERVASMYLIKTTYSFILSLLCIFLAHEYPFFPIQLSLIGVICVGIPSFFLALEANYTKVTKGFLIKVFKNAIPSGLCVCINVFLIIMLVDIFNLDYEFFRIIVIGSTGYLNLRLIYKVSIPLTNLRKILLIICFISFYSLLLIFSEFWLIKEYNLLSLIITYIFIYCDNYITDFLEQTYNKIIDIFNKRSKKNEK